MSPTASAWRNILNSPKLVTIKETTVNLVFESVGTQESFFPWKPHKPFLWTV